jgi:hypothetical protein
LCFVGPDHGASKSAVSQLCHETGKAGLDPRNTFLQLFPHPAKHSGLGRCLGQPCMAQGTGGPEKQLCRVTRTILDERAPTAALAVTSPTSPALSTPTGMASSLLEAFLTQSSKDYLDGNARTPRRRDDRSSSPGGPRRLPDIPGLRRPEQSPSTGLRIVLGSVALETSPTGRPEKLKCGFDLNLACIRLHDWCQDWA